MRGDLPGSLDHAGEVDEFDAALVRGAGGVPVPVEQVEVGQNGKGSREAELAPADGGGGRRGDDSTALEAFGDEVPSPEASPVRRTSQPLRIRAVAFLRASWAELQRVQWPDRRQVTQATTVVLGFLVVAGVYLGIADWAAQKIVNFIL